MWQVGSELCGGFSTGRPRASFPGHGGHRANGCWGSGLHPLPSSARGRRGAFPSIPAEGKEGRGAERRGSAGRAVTAQGPALSFAATRSCWGSQSEPRRPAPTTRTLRSSCGRAVPEVRPMAAQRSSAPPSRSDSYLPKERTSNFTQSLTARQAAGTPGCACSSPAAWDAAPALTLRSAGSWEA